MQIVISVCYGVSFSPLIWSYVFLFFGLCRTEGRRTASTGLMCLIFIFVLAPEVWRSVGGRAAVKCILASLGYSTAEGAVQTAEALTGLNLLMSWIPAAVAVVAMIVVYFYPLTKKRVEEINKGLKKVRASD